VVTSTDVIVVGGGSSGSALAGRLAARGFAVELIEAGVDFGMGPTPPALADASICDLSGEFDWNYRSVAGGGRSVQVPRGRVLGGSSAINTCISLRPDPADFARWADAAPGWAWDDVLPCLRRLETDVDYPHEPFHGSDGPTPIVRWTLQELEDVSRAFQNAAVSAGHMRLEDLNAPGTSGVGSVPMNRVGMRRHSAADAYLDATVRARMTLTCERIVDRVLFRRTRAIGVQSVAADGIRTHLAERIVLCAGSYGTPAILLRSGVGAAGHLAELGAAVVLDSPGVGQGLTDHSQVYLAARGPACGSHAPCLQTLVRMTSSPGSDVANDLQLCALNRVEVQAYAPALDPARRSQIMFCVLLQHPLSTGSVLLRDLRPDSAPLIELDYLREAADRDRYRDGMHALRRITDRAELGRCVVDAEDAHALLDEDLLARLVGERVQTAHHPMRTARMGRASDPDAVVGADLAVHGLDGLSIADASVIPTPVHANTHLTCLMLGERLADILSES
jgi:choline dehydrogenase